MTRRPLRRRRRVVTATAAAIALVVPAMLAGCGGATHEPVDAVPSSLDLPWMWQATVAMDPPGRAAIVYGGDAMRGSDLFDSEGKLAVVGRTGKTRMLLYSGMDDITAGEDVLLSPDGRFVAQAFLEGVSEGGMIITDLATGRNTTVPGTQGQAWWTPVAWAPDGNALLATQSGEYSWHDNVGMPGQRFVLLDLTTGANVVLTDFLRGHDIRMASRGAFAPDGTRMVLTEQSAIRLVDRAGTTVWSRDLGRRRFLAGVGAFTPDGSRIVTVTLDGCLERCDETALARRRWTFGYLDATTGEDTAGPLLAPVTGMAVRALGWIQARELAALRYEPERDAHMTEFAPWDDTGWWETGHITLLGLGSAQTTRVIMDPPDGVLTLDIPSDLLTADSFGGPRSHASFTPVRPRVFRAVVVITAVQSVFIIAVTFLVIVAASRILKRTVRGRRAGRPAPVGGAAPPG